MKKKILVLISGIVFIAVMIVNVQNSEVDKNQQKTVLVEIGNTAFAYIPIGKKCTRKNLCRTRITWDMCSSSDCLPEPL